MKRMSMEEFDEYIKSSTISQFLFHYANQERSQVGHYIKMSITFNSIEVMPECELIKFSSDNGCMFADHVDSVSVRSENKLGTIIEIFCARSSINRDGWRITMSAM